MQMENVSPATTPASPALGTAPQSASTACGPTSYTTMSAFRNVQRDSLEAEADACLAAMVASPAPPTPPAANVPPTSTFTTMNALPLVLLGKSTPLSEVSCSLA